MPSTRQLKVGKQLQKDLAEIIRQQGMAFYKGAMVTVVDVDMSPNLSYAKVYVSIFPTSKIDEVQRLINARALRTALAERVKHQLRIVPELSFHVDTSLDYVAHIDELLKNEPPQ